MFVPDADADFTALLQGDVIKDVPLVGTLELDKVTSIGASSWAYPSQLKLGFCAVLSHSCEIARENNEKVTSCILAPIRNADGATKSDLFAILERNEVKANEPTFLKYFYIPPNEKLTNTNGVLVDFTKIFSVRKTSIQFLVDRKVLQMADEDRRVFAMKLAFYFYRGASG